MLHAIIDMIAVMFSVPLFSDIFDGFIQIFHVAVRKYKAI